MSMQKKAKKRLILSSAAIVLAAGLGVGGWLFWQYRNDQKTVEVQPVSYLSTSYWGDTAQSSGNITSDYIQELYPDSSKTITDVFVTEGQEVSIGDPLLQYDKTKLELDVEAKDIAVKQAEIELDDAEDIDDFEFEGPEEPTVNEDNLEELAAPEELSAEEEAEQRRLYEEDNEDIPIEGDDDLVF